MTFWGRVGPKEKEEGLRGVLGRLSVATLSDGRRQVDSGLVSSGGSGFITPVITVDHQLCS